MQLEEVYGKEGTATIRGNCATTVYLGGGRDFATAKQISEETGKETVYKYDWSRQGSGIGATSTRQRNSLARDVYDPNEVSTLPATKALVLIGDKQPIVDDKSLVWEHRNYDPTYMGTEPERAFDYLAWKRAGRPMGDDLASWESAHFDAVVPARRAHQLAVRQHRLALHEIAEAQESGTDDHVARARTRFLEAHAESARVRLAVAERSARRAAGATDDGGLTLRDIDAAEMAEWLVEADLRSTLGPQEASAALELLE